MPAVNASSETIKTMMSSYEKPADENPNASRDGRVMPLASIIPADSKFKHP